MSSALVPCSGVGQPESGALADTAEILAGLCQRVAALERRVIKKRPDTNARRMTRLDRCPFGWKPHPKNPAVLIEDTTEQQSIFRLVETGPRPKSLVPGVVPPARCRRMQTARREAMGRGARAGALDLAPGGHPNPGGCEGCRSAAD